MRRVASALAVVALAGAAYVSVDARLQSPTPDLDRVLDEPVLARALVGIRVESLRDGRVLYDRNSAKLVMPASNMKLLTVAVAADRLGWDFRYETRLEASGTVQDGALQGDLVVVGSGDPSIGAQDFAAAPLFEEWADALVKAGITRIDGRLIGDDDVFDDRGLGPGWSWDYIGDGYATPVSGLNYNENVAVLRVWPGKAAGDPVTIDLSPAGHELDVTSTIVTGEPASSTSIEFSRIAGSPRLTIRGSVPAGGNVVVRTASVENPTRFFVEGLRLALKARGIDVTKGAWDIDDTPRSAAPSTERRLLARHESWPLSALAAYCLKVSQNFYAETLLKTIGRVSVLAAGTGGAPIPGSVSTGRDVLKSTFTSWGIAPDSYVIADGSGLSRYDFVSAEAIVGVLKHVWNDERLRGPFAAALPVAGRDGSLDTRMKGSVLDANVQAKTGTISNVRSLSGYLETAKGEKLVFSVIVNNFTAPTSQIDAVVERFLAKIVDQTPAGGGH